MLLATASDAIIVGFNVSPMGNARQELQIRKKSISEHTLLFMMPLMILKMQWKECYLQKLKKKLQVMLKLEKPLKFLKLVTIAGCMVMSGKIFRNSGIRIN